MTHHARSLLCIAALLACARSDAAPGGGYRGTITFARGSVVGPETVVDLDVATDGVVGRFGGWDPQRTPSGESAYVSRVGGGYFGDAAVVAADARGVPGPALWICKSYNWSSNHVCHTPKLAPDGKLVAFGVVGGGGKVCRDQYGMFFADHVVVRDRAGRDVASFEGYYLPEWLPDGRLLMMGTQCRGAGVWISERLGEPRRVDGGQVAVPGGQPSISPDGRTLAMVWNGQLWTMSLDGRHELTQITRFDQTVAAAAWSPDGRAFAVLLYDVSLPVKVLVLFRPGDAASQVVKPLAFYPYGPLSWH
jgi:WD40 repeat protein